MAFDQSTITRVWPPQRSAGQLVLRWDSTSPAGTVFQVYVGRKLAWGGIGRTATIPYPDSRKRIDVGAVGPTEARVDFSASLPGAFADKAELSWLGGTYLDTTGGDDLVGFRIYGSASAGGPIDYDTPIGDVAAYTDGIVTDGFGLGGFGQGGFGRAAASYSWTSGPLAFGSWQFAVRSYDAAGNEGVASTVSVLSNAPPLPPAPNAVGKRLTYTYSQSTHQVTLDWLASPG